MRSWLVLPIVLIAACSPVRGDGMAAAARQIPLPPGRYAFAHRYAEQPRLALHDVDVLIAGPHVTVINPGANDGFPEGVIAEGTLAWHAPSRQWIIANDPSDATATEVGGCSGGPDVIDLRHRVYWTC